jgi:hypothetical protein
MKYAIEMGSDPMMYIPGLVKTGSGIQKLMGWGIHRQHGDGISLLLFFHNKDSTLKNGLLGKNFHITD